MYIYIQCHIYIYTYILYIYNYYIYDNYNYVYILHNMIIINRKVMYFLLWHMEFYNLISKWCIQYMDNKGDYQINFDYRAFDTLIFFLYPYESHHC